jgi:uncharacterized Fe-S center protein
MKSKVHQITAQSKSFAYKSGLMGKFEKLLEEFDLKRFIPENELVPLKMHLSNNGAFKTIRPQYIKKVA